MNGVWVKVKRNYGQLAIYPDNDTARGIAEIAGTKTLTPKALAVCRRMGFGMAMEGCREDVQAVTDQINAINNPRPRNSDGSSLGVDDGELDSLVGRGA